VWITLLFLISASSIAAATQFKTLYRFKGGTDGQGPSGLVMDPGGNLYGTTSGGGTYGAGTVFRLDALGRKTVLYNFTGGLDGANPHPYAKLAFDAAGNIYGTTVSGGADGRGVAYKLDTKGLETVLYNFCAAFMFPCPDGAFPTAGLTLDPSGNIFGTTPLGGADYVGVFFKLAQLSDGSWSETVLHTFTISDGDSPYGGLVRDSARNLYGTTWGGGAHMEGTIFKVNSAGEEEVLYNFTGASDGASPYSAPLRDAEGNFYGTIPWGGNPSCPGIYGTGCGTVYELDNTGTLQVLHTFTGGADGASPFGSVVRDSKGNLYGTTSAGGAYGYGVVFKLRRDAQGAWQESVVHAFADKPGGDSGASPIAGLLLDAAGNVYGTTNGDGVVSFGSVFEITK
jgi:uncharacterized repeat protein (TIGR03803 family)